MSPELSRALLTVLGGILAVVLGPWVADKLRKVREARSGDASIGVRQIDHTENLFALYREELDRHMGRVRELEARVTELTRWKAEHEQFVAETHEDIADLIRLMQAVIEHGTEENISQVTRLLEQMQKRVQSRLERRPNGREAESA